MSCICTGICCELIVITSHKIDKFNKILAERVKCGNKDVLFMKKNWIQVSVEQALIIRPELKEHKKDYLMQFPFFTCKQFNSDTRKCMEYKNRPSTCRRYPYLGKKKLPIKTLLKRVNVNCGYAKVHPDYAEGMKNSRG